MFRGKYDALKVSSQLPNLHAASQVPKYKGNVFSDAVVGPSILA
jgi:hypothetical protein